MECLECLECPVWEALQRVEEAEDNLFVSIVYHQETKETDGDKVPRSIMYALSDGVQVMKPFIWDRYLNYRPLRSCRNLCS